MRSLRMWSVMVLCFAARLGFAAAPSGPHPRFLVGGVKATLAANQTRPQIAAVIAKCDAHSGDVIDSGYQGFDWAAQMSSCALAWHATGDVNRGKQAVTYWKALLDDGTKVADKKGGATGYLGGPIVSQDSGYSMRTYGLYSALGLDWLHDAPGVDDTLRTHAISLIKVFTDWYAANGYLRDDPGNNYFTGYFIALWASAIAIGTDDMTIGPALWAKADQLTQRLVVPHMAGMLQGGDWLEGWEYGELASASYLVAETAAVENGYAAFTGSFASDIVAFHLYGLRPDGSFYDAGDQQDHPTTPGSTSIWGALVARPNGISAEYARQYLTIAPKVDTTILWAQAIAEAKSATWPKRDWTQDGLPLSYLAKGGGTYIVRGGWTANDTWASFHVAARDGANSHQHADAGHFELMRGKDALAITSADYGTFATWNHNALLFDDQGRHLNYPPNQGAWGSPSKVRLTRVAEVGVAACAQGDFADAYVNNNGPSSIKLARRDFVFFRPDTVIIHDRTSVDQASVKSTFVLHTSKNATVAGQDLDVDIGASHLHSRTLLPSASTRTTVNEPVANAGQAPWSNNDTYAPAFRAEETVTGNVNNAFLHVLSGTALGAATTATVTDAGGAHVIAIDSGRVVVLPAAADGSDLALPFTYSVPSGAHVDHVVFGLSRTAFSLAVTTSGSDCQITLSAGSDPHVTSGDATCAFHLDGCTAGMPPQLSDGGVPPAEIPDAGTPSDGGEGAKPSGCACAFADNARPTWVLWLALALVVYRVRRRC